MKRRDKITIAVGLICMILTIIAGFSYAYWLIHLEQQTENVLATSCVNIEFDNGENGFELTKAFPISDEQGEELIPYTFTIRNTCDVSGYVDISLETMDLGSITPLQEEFVHTSLTKKDIPVFNDTLNNGEEGTPTIEGADKAYNLTRQYMKPLSSQEYNLRLWVDKSMTLDDVSSNTTGFTSKINLTFNQTDPLFVHSGTLMPMPQLDRGVTATPDNKYFWYYANTISDIYVEGVLDPIDDAMHSWDVSEAQDGSVMAYVVDNGNSTQTLHLQGIGGIKLPTKCRNLFQDFYLANTIHNMELLDFSNVIDMYSMFQNFGRNSTRDIYFDMSTVTVPRAENLECSFSYIGESATNNSSIYINFGDDFNASSALNTRSMFERVGSYAVLDKIIINLGENFNIENATDVGYMFSSVGQNSSNPPRIVKIDFGKNFNMRKATDSDYYFLGNVNAKELVDINLGDNFNIESANIIRSMFYYIGTDSKDVKIDLGKNFNAKNATSLYETFRYIGSRSTGSINIDFGDNFGGDALTDINSIFYGLGRLSSGFPEITIDFGNYFNTSNVTNMSMLFTGVGEYSKSIKIIFGPHFDTSKVTNMYEMFGFMGRYNSINSSESSPKIELILENPISLKSVTNISSMFQSIGSIKGLVLDASEMSNSVNYSSIFLNTNFANSDTYITFLYSDANEIVVKNIANTCPVSGKVVAIKKEG